MLTKDQEKQVLAALDEQMDVQDVYFCKGKLYVINAYDIPLVEEFLDETSWGADLEYVYVEDEAYSTQY